MLTIKWVSELRGRGLGLPEGITGSRDVGSDAVGKDDFVIRVLRLEVGATMEGGAGVCATEAVETVVVAFKVECVGGLAGFIVVEVRMPFAAKVSMTAGAITPLSRSSSRSPAR